MSKYNRNAQTERIKARNNHYKDRQEEREYNRSRYPDAYPEAK